jgi:nicotinamidase-related amidase
MTESDQTRELLRTIAYFNIHRMRLRKKKTALLIVDMQNFFVNSRSKGLGPISPFVMSNTKRVLKAFRKAERPVIYTRHVHRRDGSDAGMMGWWWDDMIVEGSWESEIHEELAPRPEEKVIQKHRYSAFYNTDLEIILRCQGIEDLVISGVMTNLCCESTARDAYMRDFRVFFLADATGTAYEEMHIASLLNLSYGFAYVTTAEKVISQLMGREDRE